MARSDNWRINKSSLMPVEGAQILSALRKVAGAAGLPPSYKVKFATDTKHSGIDFDNKEVVVGAGRLFQEAPMPSKNMDILVGLTLHEVGHHVIGTERVLRGTNARVDAFHSNQSDELFQTFVNIGEDVVVESRTLSNPNLSDYAKSLHDWNALNMRDAKTNRLLELWIEYALGHKSEAMLDLPPEMNEAMSQLVALTGWLRRYEPSRSVGDRIGAYQRYWSTLKDVILNPPKPPEPQSEQTTGQNEGGEAENQGQLESPPTEPEEDEEEDENEPDSNEPESPSGAGAETPTPNTPESKEPEPSNESATPQTDGDTEPSAPALDDDLASGSAEIEEDKMDVPLAPRPEDNIDSELEKAIEEAVEYESEDITDQVHEELGDKHGASRLVIRSRETKTPLIKPDTVLRKKLERIMTIRKRLQARTMHGEQYGRIDKRHLHRIGTDQRIFNLRYKFPDGFPNTRILIDLSDSMSGHDADEVLEAAGALQTLVNAEVWCYNNTNQINLVRMDEGRLIHQFQPNGNTPSGIAIVGVSLGMKRGGLIIHLTDGGHNQGQPPWNANWVLKGHGIELVNLIWGNSTSHYDLEGINFRKINGLADFPEALYQILVEKARLSKIGGK